MSSGPPIHNLLESFSPQLFNATETSYIEISKKLSRSIETKKEHLDTQAASSLITKLADSALDLIHFDSRDTKVIFF